MNVKLGKKLGKVEDPRTLRASKLIAFGTELKIPDAWRIGSTRHTVPMFRNDEIGVCTCASQGHRIIVQEAAVGQKEIALTDDDVVNTYAGVTGYPTTGDNGAYMLDVANYMRRVGMGREKDGSPHTVTAFAEVSRNSRLVKASMMLFGGLWLGIWLPKSAQWQTGPTEAWGVPAGGPTGDGEPGSWGGHAVYAVGYGPSYITLYTWGREQRMTWGFFDTYVDEAYIFITEDFLFKSRQETPRGFNVKVLEGFLQELKK